MHYQVSRRLLFSVCLFLFAVCHRTWTCFAFSVLAPSTRWIFKTIQILIQTNLDSLQTCYNYECLFTCTGVGSGPENNVIEYLSAAVYEKHSRV